MSCCLRVRGSPGSPTPSTHAFLRGASGHPNAPSHYCYNIDNIIGPPPLRSVCARPYSYVDKLPYPKVLFMLLIHIEHSLNYLSHHEVDQYYLAAPQSTLLLICTCYLLLVLMQLQTSTDPFSYSDGR